MTRPLSIFSFKTLQASFRPGPAVWLALVLLLAAEIGVRLFTPNLGWYEGLTSLGQWVDRLEYEVKTRQPEVWLMGNSVLAYGVDIPRLEQQTYLPSVALPFGGSTLSGDTAMLEYFLRRAASPPKKVVFCLTKDDLNTKGERSWISEKYMKYDTWRGLSIDRIFRLADSRNTIMNHLKALLFTHSDVSIRQPSEPSFAGIISAEKTTYMKRLMHQFTFDESIFLHIADLSTKYGFTVSIVLMPVSNAYIQFHDERNPSLSCSQIHRQVEILCAQYGFAYWDFSGMAPDTIEYFADPYHMTEEGRNHFTPLLAERIQPAYEGIKTRVACIGDSITSGAGTTNRNTQSYPAILQHLSRGKFTVANFGVSGTTLLRNSGRSWMDTPAYSAAMEFDPNIVIIMFGINDLAHPDILDQFTTDGKALITQFKALPSSPDIYLCTPTPIAPPRQAKEANQVIQTILNPAIRKIAEETDATVIHIFDVFPNTQKLLPDTTHPNAEGNAIIARTIFDVLSQ